MTDPAPRPADPEGEALLDQMARLIYGEGLWHRRQASYLLSSFLASHAARVREECAKHINARSDECQRQAEEAKARGDEDTYASLLALSGELELEAAALRSGAAPEANGEEVASDLHMARLVAIDLEARDCMKWAGAIRRLVSASSHLGAATGTWWTAERPTKPGWYWLLRKPGLVPTIVQVDFASPPRWITVVIENGNRYGIEGVNGEWSGPLAPPPEDQHGS